MRNRSMSILALGLFFLTAGCQSPIAGTWKIAAGQPVGQVSIAAMTLAEDGTFTANAAYGEHSQVISGHYTFTSDKLTFMSDGTTRNYGASLSADELSVTHGDTTIRMVRMAPR